MSTKKERFESLKKTIYALLVPYKNGCTIKQLTQDYYDIQEESIPFEKFGYGSLINLLRDMNDTVYTEFNSGKHFFKCIPSSNSAHLTTLVAGQKADQRKGRFTRKQFRPSVYYPNVPVPPIHIPVEVMSAIIDLVSKHPKGIHKTEVLQLVHKKMPGAFITMQDMDEQLKQISHQVLVRGCNIYYVQPKQSSSESPVVYNNQRIPNTTNIYVGGCENPEELYYCDDEDDFKFLPGSCQGSASKKTSSMSRKPISCFIEDTLLNNPDHVSNERIKNTSQERKNDVEQYSFNVGKEYHEINTEDINTMDEEDAHYLSCKNTELLISERLKFRLEKLTEKYPDGIWCAELPDKYLEEYKVSLCYVELGFSSVREFASHLPNIFHCVSSHGIGDYKLYSAKSSIPSHINNKPVVPKLMDLHTMPPNIWDNENDVLPSIASTATCKELIPDEVMTIGECVALISVESLAHMDDQYLEVVVVEVFTPSFFWIQLRKNKKPFKAFMNELHRFYEMNSGKYEIPSVVLEKGLNCACTYNGLWHRGIIKTVNPDLLVTVFFYDYGTLKTYPASHLRYLHRSFSHLPAQAVPCGLVNTKPYSGTKWTRSVTNEFASKTCNIPLVATISAINEEDNSLMVTLTDTSDEEDLHINDWMVEKKLALHGKMVDCVEMKDMLLYVEENLLYSPELCFGEESVTPRQRKESEDEPINDPLIFPKSVLVDKPLVTPPPGFSVPGKPLTLETIIEEHNQSSSSSTTEKNVPTVNSGINNNPFTQERAHPRLDHQLTAQQLIELYNINLQLQMHITDAWKSLLSSCANDQYNTRESLTATLEALIKNKVPESFIDSISHSKAEINKPTETTSIHDRKWTDAIPADYSYKPSFHNSTVLSDTSSNFGESTLSASKMNEHCTVPSDTNNYYQHGSQSLLYNSCTNGYDLSSNYSNGITAMANLCKQGRMTTSACDNISESIHTLNESFNKLSVADSHTSTYLTTPIGTYSSYSNRDQTESVRFTESSRVNTNTCNPAYRNDSSNHTINNYESLNSKVVGHKETNPFKLSLAGKLRISDSNDTTSLDTHYDNSTSKHYYPVHGIVIPQPTINTCPNGAASQYPYQPHAPEPLSKLDNCDMYSTNHLQNMDLNNREAMYFPSALGTTNVWSIDNMNAFNGYTGGNTMYYNVPKGTRPKEVTPEIRTSNMYARNNVKNDYSNQIIVQESTCRPTSNCSSNIFCSDINAESTCRPTSDCSSNIFRSEINAGMQNVHFDSSRLFEVPHMYSDRRPNQEQSVTNDYDIKVQVPNTTSRICSNGLLNGNPHHLESNGSSWSPITGFTSPLLMESMDEGYQTRPSTSSTLQSSPPLLETISEEEFKRQFTSSETNKVKNTYMNTSMQLLEDVKTCKNGTNKTENLTQILPNKHALNTCQNGASIERLVDLESQGCINDLNNKVPPKKMKIFNCGANLLCRQVELPGYCIHIFHYRGEGWILTADFVDAFTQFQSATYMISVFHILDLNIEYLQIDKFNFAKIPELDSKIKKIAKDDGGCPYTRVHLIPLKNAIKVLTKLNIVTKDEIHNAIAKKEFTEGSITHQMWVIITAYGEFLRVIENCESGEWI